MKNLDTDARVKTSIALSGLNSDDKGTIESKGDESSTSNGKALANSSGGVS